MKNASFLMRLLVLIYDGLLLVGVILVGYALLFGLFSMMPQSNLSQSLELSLIGKALKLIYLVGFSFAFYGWFWTHGGQTLGMKVWNLYLVDQNGKFISWRRAVLRYMSALISWIAIASVLYLADFGRWYITIGIGFSWMLFDKNNLAWHDILSATRILQLPKDKKNPR